jgi:diguanylate cyclase (GGDEF)-like protein
MTRLDSEKHTLGHPARPFPDDAPAAQPVAQRRAPEDATDAALAACAALMPRLAALQALTDPAAQRQVLLQLPAALQAAGLALSRLEADGGRDARADGGGDLLTGLADRPQLLAGVARLALQYPDTPMMVLAADVDHLRHVNDTRSHAVGDAVLQAFAGVLRAQSRPQDVLARAHGSLFVVALGGPVSTTRALLVAERLRAAIEGHAWDGVRIGLRVTASIGVAARAPGESLDDALARAGAALQECKRSGRNQVRSRL